MKKLYRKGTVHPSPQIKPDDHRLSLLLPTVILSLTAALSPEDREVLAYLISSSFSFSGDPNPKTHPHNSKTHKTLNDDFHSPLFNCDCFSCYTSYWVRWDSSPNRQLIHEILDAFEDSLEMKKKNRSGKRNRKKRGKASFHGGDVERVGPSQLSESSTSGTELGSGGGGGGVAGSDMVEERGSGGGGEVGDEKSSVRRFVSFLGEKILSAWG